MGNQSPVDTNSEESIELARDFLQRLLDHMDLQARVEAAIQPPSELDDEETYYLNIEGEDLGNLIGRRGETLDALQYLVRLVVNQRTHKWPHVEVDVEHYKQRRESSLMRLAVSTADRAVSEKRTLVLEAMPARERRIVHLALRGRTDVTTRSVGEDDSRKVTIIPT
jgi:spoIIIJ-associated protein